ncbi:MAG: DUF4019 domain-containing protein [Pseudomonadota bacterium]
MPHFRSTRVPRAHHHTSGRTAKSVLVLALAGLILGVASTAMPARDAQAQPQAPAQAQTAKAAQIATADTSPGALLAAADRTLALLDAGSYAALWQDMPAELQARFKQDTFIADMQSTRQSVGTLRQRSWSGIGRLRYATPSTPQGVPAGLYANVEMSSTTADGRSLIERVSFRIESDGSFRFTGYMPRPLATAAAASGASQ